jgi:acid phosphatase type 7
LFVGLACEYFDYEFVSMQQAAASWRMVNLRRPLEFRYYSRDRSCTGNYTLMGRSPTVQPSNGNEPTHVHVAYGDRLDQMFVSFLTNSSTAPVSCEYGVDPSSLAWRTLGTTTTYTASDMCEGRANQWGPQAFIEPGFMHTVLLQALLPSTTYFYRVGSDVDGWSAVFSFTNRPGDGDEPVTLIAYGDMGLSPVEPGANSTINRVTARVTTSNITCLLHIGDISYARGIGALWDAFMTQIEPIAAHVPYMVAIGNHEYDHVTGGDKDPSGATGPGGFRPGWSVVQR